MALWKIVPVANTDDPRWLDHPIWREVVVRAPTAAHARLMAAEMEREAAGSDRRIGNESESFQSGFEDEKLYAVKPLDPREMPDVKPDGPDEVVRPVRAE